jgi:hypothetical protein
LGIFWFLLWDLEAGSASVSAMFWPLEAQEESFPAATSSCGKEGNAYDGSARVASSEHSVKVDQALV